VPFTVIYDANVLYPAPLRDLLIRLAQTSLVQARWTNEILDEAFENLIANRPDLDPQRLAITRQRMVGAVRDCLVEGYGPLIRGLTLPDPDDRHVLAAAIKAGAQSIVTFNLRDFPDDDLEQWDVQAQHPDDFVLGLIELGAGVVLRVLDEQRLALRNAPSRAALCATLENNGLKKTSSALRQIGATP
jgi:predicted nucleic acid-binding protein